MKQFKPVIICAVVLLVVAALAFGAIKLFPEISDTTDNPVNDGPATSGLNKIVDRSSQDVKSVEITTDGGESFAIDYSKDSIGAQTATMRGADARLAYSESEMTTLSGFVGLLVALEEVGTGEDSLFGFDKPQRTIKVTFNDGETVTLLIGSETPLGTGVYIRRTDRDTVYTVGGSTTDILMMTKSDYRDIELFDTVSSADLLTSVTVSRPGKPDLTVLRKEDADEKKEMTQAEAALATDYEIVSPIKRDANPDTINSALLDKVIAIKAAALVEDYPKDLAKYGLSKPVKLSFKTSEGGDVTLLIGDKAPDGGRYVMPDGVPTVIATEEDCDFTAISHADIATRLLWYFASEDVSEVLYELPGGARHTLKLTADDKSLKGVYDGKEMTGKNATNLFLRTIRFTLSGEYTSDMKYGESAVKITAKLSTGKTTTLELCEINERQYAAIIDGKAPQFYVSVGEVKELIESFDILARGEDIPDMF